MRLGRWRIAFTMPSPTASVAASRTIWPFMLASGEAVAGFKSQRLSESAARNGRRMTSGVLHDLPFTIVSPRKVRPSLRQLFDTISGRRNTACGDRVKPRGRHRRRPIMPWHIACEGRVAPRRSRPCRRKQLGRLRWGHARRSATGPKASHRSHAPRLKSQESGRMTPHDDFS